MSQSLPTPGGDVGTWGIMLNGFLNVSHNSDGTLSTSAVSTAGAEMTSNKNQASGYAGLNSSTLIPTTYLGSGTGSSSNFLRGDGSWQVPPTASNATSSAVGLIQLAGDLGGSATSPTIAKLQGTTLSTPTGGATSYLNATGAWSTPPSASNATTSTPGLVQLAGDLGGSGSTATVPTLATTVNSQAVIRTAALQAPVRHGSSASDNVPYGLQNTTTVTAASNSVNVATVGSNWTLNVVSTAQFSSPSGPLYSTSPQILSIQIGAPGSGIGGAQGSYTGTVQVSYTGTTATSFTGCNTINGGTGTLATGYSVYASPVAVADVVVCADSIFYGEGSDISKVNSTDWFSDLLNKENREAGLPDSGRGWRPCSGGTYGLLAWSNLAAGSAAANVGPQAYSKISTCWNPGATSAVIGDTFPFRRAIVYIQKQSNGAGVAVSFNGGSTYTSTYDTNGTGVITVDSGDLGSYATRTVQVKQMAAVSGSGANGLAVAGYLPYTNDGTSGVVGYNWATSASTTSDWISSTGWNTYWLQFIQPRRIYIAIGVNDLGGGTSLSTLSSNLTTLVQSAQAASPLSEIVLCAEHHPGANGAGGWNAYNTGISSANWYTYVNTVAAVALANNCTFIDISSWLGDIAVWAVASVTTTSGGTSATVSSGGFPNVEVGMNVQGTGIPLIPNGVYVSSISGNTINFSGNTAGIALGTNTLLFTNDVLGLTAGDGVHLGDAAHSLSGRDAHMALADMFWNNLSYYRALPPYAAGPGWNVDSRAWTYVSATQFTIISPSNMSGIYAKSTKVTWSESGTVKYGVIASSSFSSGVTTVNLIPTSDYQMAATPDLGSTWYSYASPPGFPTSFTWFLTTTTASCTWTTSSSAVTTSSSFTTAGVLAGMSVMGTGIPAGVTVSSVNSATSLTLSTGTGVTGGSGTLTFSWIAGFSSLGAVNLATWKVSDGLCSLIFDTYLTGTSNATTFSLTAPVTSETGSVPTTLGTGTDNGTAITATVVTMPGSTKTITLAKNVVSGAWTSSGSKGAVFSFSYTI